MTEVKERPKFTMGEARLFQKAAGFAMTSPRARDDEYMLDTLYGYAFVLKVRENPKTTLKDIDGLDMTELSAWVFEQLGVDTNDE